MIFGKLEEAKLDLFFELELDDQYLRICVPAEEITLKAPPNIIFSRETIRFFFLDRRYTLVLCKGKPVQAMCQSAENAVPLTLVLLTERDYCSAVEEQDRMDILIEGSRYYGQNPDIKFKYSLDPEQIQKMKHTFPILETVANKYKSDLSVMKHLLLWTGQQLRHNGQSSLPLYRDAINLYHYALSHGGALNCRGLAVFFCELCLAAGLQARYVICSQKEIKYRDCHVVTTAYASELNKWIYLDPSYCLMLYDKSGNELSLMEFRSYVIRQEPVFPNTEARHGTYEIDFNLFCKTMVKKLYKFACPRHLFFGMDQFADDNLVYLVPDTRKYPSISCTSSCEAFWAKPITFR